MHMTIPKFNFGYSLKITNVEKQPHRVAPLAILD